MRPPTRRPARAKTSAHHPADRLPSAPAAGPHNRVVPPGAGEGATAAGAARPAISPQPAIFPQPAISPQQAISPQPGERTCALCAEPFEGPGLPYRIVLACTHGGTD